eukprot:COSAG01_NODE_2966_length_6790_cov_15.092662_6_plen_98_part_00
MSVERGDCDATQGVDSAKGVEMAHFTVLYQQTADEMDVAVDYERYIAVDQVSQAASGCPNDAPCPPCTSHGASITQPFGVACHPNNRPAQLTIAPLN